MAFQVILPTKNIDELFIKENCMSIYKGVQQLIKFTKETI